MMRTAAVVFKRTVVMGHDEDSSCCFQKDCTDES